MRHVSFAHGEVKWKQHETVTSSHTRHPDMGTSQSADRAPPPNSARSTFNGAASAASTTLLPASKRQAAQQQQEMAKSHEYREFLFKLPIGELRSLADAQGALTPAIKLEHERRDQDSIGLRRELVTLILDAERNLRGDEDQLVGTTTPRNLEPSRLDPRSPVPGIHNHHSPRRAMTSSARKSHIKSAEAALPSSGNNAGSSSTLSNLAALPSTVALGYEELVGAIIRPPRAEYEESALGRKIFRLGARVFERFDIELDNGRGCLLKCSWWMPKPPTTPNAKKNPLSLPCVVYLHGNSGCRWEALETLPTILDAGATLFAFDFAGSGLSQGSHVSLGYFEREDLDRVVRYLREEAGEKCVSAVGLWGRSMGAVTALMYAERDPSISCMVLDSPFTSLTSLAKELVVNTKVRIPSFAVTIAMQFIRNSVKARAGFDIYELDTTVCAKKSFVPALFATGTEDSFILPHHAKDVFEVYAGDKNIITFPGEHNSPRPDFFYDSASIFLDQCMISQTASPRSSTCFPLGALTGGMESSEDLSSLVGVSEAASFTRSVPEMSSSLERMTNVFEPNHPDLASQAEQEERDLRMAIEASLLSLNMDESGLTAGNKGGIPLEQAYASSDELCDGELCTETEVNPHLKTTSDLPLSTVEGEEPCRSENCLQSTLLEEPRAIHEETEDIQRSEASPEQPSVVFDCTNPNLPAPDSSTNPFDDLDDAAFQKSDDNVADSEESSDEVFKEEESTLFLEQLQTNEEDEESLDELTQRALLLSLSDA